MVDIDLAIRSRIGRQEAGCSVVDAQVFRLALQFCLALIGATVLFVCSTAAQTNPVYNKVYGIATHNSYWLNRSDQVDYFSSGTQELLTDQLLHEHVRAIEIDVHSEGAPAHEWKVYHTSDSEDFSCRYLSDCLEFLRNFHYAVPHHEVINVVVELKNTVPTTGADFPGIPVHFNFASDHTMEDFDGIFRRVLGNTLYTPKDFLGRCAAGATMRQCARIKGWPTIEELRGKFIINVLGNWSTAAYDWAHYAGENIQNRVAFPMQSVFQLFLQPCALSVPQIPNPINPKGPPLPDPTHVDLKTGGTAICVGDIDAFDPSPAMDQALRQAAFDASVFWQLEDLRPAALSAANQFLAENGVIRGHDSYGFGDSCAPGPQDCQEVRIRSGFQMIQTDYPWHFVNDSAWNTLHIPVDPSQRLRDPRSLPDANGHLGQYSVFRELGSRFYFQTGPAWPGVWAYAEVPTFSDRWLEVTVSSTRHGDTWGETTHDGLILDDYVKTCPYHPSAAEQEAAKIFKTLAGLECTNYVRAAQEDGEGCIKAMSESEQDGVEICRQKNTTAGASFYQESVDLYVRVYRNGQKVMDKEFRSARYGPCKRPSDPNSADVSDKCIGSLIAIAIKNSGQSSQITVYSAGKLRESGPSEPYWQALDSESFSVALTKQGFRGWKSELLVGARVADKLAPVHDVVVGPPSGSRSASGSPSGVVVGPPSGTRNTEFLPDLTRLHDVTLFDLPKREVAGNDSSSRVVDLSNPATRIGEQQFRKNR